jgi:hypothetical protein
MPSSRVTVALGIGVVFLFVAVALPSMVAAPDSTQEVTETYAEGSNQVVDGALVLGVNSTGPNSATVSLSSVDNGDLETITLAEGESQTVELAAGNVSVSLVSSTSSEATVSLEYPSTLGWDGGALALTEHWGLFVVVVGVVAVFGLLVRYR